MPEHDGRQIEPWGTGPWVPEHRVETVGTHVLIDARQARIWEYAIEDADDVALTEHDGRERDRKVGDIHHRAWREIEQIHDNGPDPDVSPAEITDIMFGRTRQDVELLMLAGTIRQPYPPSALMARIREPVNSAPLWAAGGVATGFWGIREGVAGDWFSMALLLVIAACLMVLAGVSHWKRKIDRDDLQSGPEVKKKDGTKTRTLTVGINENLADLMRDLYEEVPDTTDLVWGAYEELTAAADDVAVKRDVLSPTELAAAERDIKQLARRIDFDIMQRRRKRLEERQIQRELTQRSETDPLGRSLGDPNDRWKGILPLPEELTSRSDEDQERP